MLGNAYLGQDHPNNSAIPDTIVMGVLIIISQIVVAGPRPWVGYYSEWLGRKPLLLVGLGAQAARGLALACFSNYPVFVFAQVLDGISGAMLGVLTLLVITDLAAGSGRFNLVRGMVATLSGIAASISTGAFGFLIQRIGDSMEFLAMGAASALLRWL